uniref:Wortmanamides biosynthesis cluster protein C n=1 Tax=Talaromyces wortmannii TaxID=28567 RepID=TWMC_TALWO|nr:RecName: Full=Wortmanamides biosynthesis cluster protein C [Talaromyces wortmannii]AUY61971.1 TwnC [Talaromyces wortmannii]QBC19711.1 TwmC [Talaromyces wortmannii]
MAFEIPEDSTQLSQFVTLLIFTPLGIVVTALRFVAVRRVTRKVGFEDWLAVIATIFFILTNLAGLMAISILNGRQLTQEVIESPSDYSRMRKWDIAGLFFYFAQTLSVKLSILAFYHRIFGISSTRCRICIYLLAAAQTILFIAFCIFQGFQCIPLQRYFDLSVPGECKDEGTVILGGELPNSLVDFAMVILAMIMIRPLQLSFSDKFRVTVLFGLGFVVGIIGFVKIAVTYSTSELYAFSMIALWTGVQMFTALLCCSLPMYNTFLPIVADFWNRLSHHSLGWVSRVRSSQSSSKNSRKHGPYDSDQSPGPGWDDLVAYNGTKGLTLPQAPYHGDNHALGNVSPITHPQAYSKQTTRQFDVV